MNGLIYLIFYKSDFSINIKIKNWGVRKVINLCSLGVWQSIDLYLLYVKMKC